MIYWHRSGRLGDGDALALQEPLPLAGLEHFAHDAAAADELALHIEMRVTWFRGMALFTAGRYEEAIAVLKEVHNPNNETRLWLTVSYAAAGHLPEARTTLNQYLAAAEQEMARFPGRSLAAWEPYLHRIIEYRDPAEFQHLRAALRTAGLA